LSQADSTSSTCSCKAVKSARNSGTTKEGRHLTGYKYRLAYGPFYSFAIEIREKILLPMLLKYMYGTSAYQAF